MREVLGCLEQHLSFGDVALVVVVLSFVGTIGRLLGQALWLCLAAWFRGRRDLYRQINRAVMQRKED